MSPFSTSLNGSLGEAVTVYDHFYLYVLIIAILAFLLSAYTLMKLTRFSRRIMLIMTSLTNRNVETYIKAIKSRKRRKPSKRYIVIRLIGSSLTKEGLQALIKRNLTILYGKSSISKMVPQVLYMNNYTGKAAVRFYANYKWMLISALGYIKQEDPIIAIIPLRTTGSLKKAKSYCDRE